AHLCGDVEQHAVAHLRLADELRVREPSDEAPVVRRTRTPGEPDVQLDGARPAPPERLDRSFAPADHPCTVAARYRGRRCPPRPPPPRRPPSGCSTSSSRWSTRPCA